MLCSWRDKLLDFDTVQVDSRNQEQTSMLGCMCTFWHRASDYFYKNMALIQQMRHNALTSNKDLSFQEVTIDALLKFESNPVENGNLHGWISYVVGRDIYEVCGASSLPSASATLQDLQLQFTAIGIRNFYKLVERHL